MTKIQWTDETWNPVVGCSKVHTGCTHCYAEVMAARPLPAFVGKHNLTITDGRWNGRIIEQHDRLLLPLKWRKSRRVFVASMSDIGHPALSDGARARIYGVMLLCPGHTFQNLTKRPQEIERFKREWSPTRCLDALMALMIGLVGRAEAWADILPAKTRWGSSSWEDVAHIHEYVSVSDQATADEFIPVLLRVPAAVRGVSLEPMVGAVDLSSAIRPDLQRYDARDCFRRNGRWGTCADCWGGAFQKPVPENCINTRRSDHALEKCWVDHVIVGGESGRNARPCEVEWIRSVVRQCKAASVPCFVKQLGSHQCMTIDPKGGLMCEWPEDLRVRMHVGEGW